MITKKTYLRMKKYLKEDGSKGIRQRNDRFEVNVRVNGKGYYGGTFATEKEAVEKRKELELEFVVPLIQQYENTVDKTPTATISVEDNFKPYKVHIDMPLSNNIIRQFYTKQEADLFIESVLRGDAVPPTNHFITHAEEAEAKKNKLKQLLRKAKKKAVAEKREQAQEQLYYSTDNVYQM